MMPLRAGHHRGRGGLYLVLVALLLSTCVYTAKAEDTQGDQDASQYQDEGIVEEKLKQEQKFRLYKDLQTAGSREERLKWLERTVISERTLARMDPAELPDDKLRQAIRHLEAVYNENTLRNERLTEYESDKLMSTSEVYRKGVQQLRNAHDDHVTDLGLVFEQLVRLIARYPDIANMALDEGHLSYKMLYDIGAYLYREEQYNISRAVMLASARLNTLRGPSEVDHDYASYAWSYIQYASAEVGDQTGAFLAAQNYLRHKPDDRTASNAMKHRQVDIDRFEADYSNYTMEQLMNSRLPVESREDRIRPVADPSLCLFTIATEFDDGLHILKASAEDYGYNLTIAGLGMKFSGYGFKLKLLQQILEESRDYCKNFMFVDAFDVIIAADSHEILRKFNSLGHPFVVSAEANCWPDQELCNRYPLSDSRYRYINSGAMIGNVEYVRTLLQTMGIAEKPDCIDDQHELALMAVYQPGSIKIDTDAVIFQSLYDAEKDVMRMQRPRNRLTGTTPCVFHANGYDKTPLVRLIEGMRWFQTYYPVARLYEILNRGASYTKRRDVAVPRCMEKSTEYAKSSYSSGPDDVPSQHQTHTLVIDQSNPSHEPRPTTINMEKVVDDIARLSNAVRDIPAPPAPTAPISLDNLTPGQAAYDQAHRKAITKLVSYLQPLYRDIRYGEHQEYRAYCADVHSPEEMRTCVVSPNRPDCFDYSRCQGKDFKVYVYPEDRSLDMSAPYHEVLETVRGSPYYTDDPEEACLFLPGFDPYCMLEDCMQVSGWLFADGPEQWLRSAQIEHKLKQLPYWNGGRNHLIFQKHEAPCTPYDIGAAILVKADISIFHHRAGHDISVPYFALRNFTDSERERPVSQRDNLLVFKGMRTMPLIAIRDRIRYLHNGKDIIIAGLCRIFGYMDRNCIDDIDQYVQYDFRELLLNSKFGLVVEGYGYNSYRLLETMAAGAIPVIAVDFLVLPFSEVLDWSEFAVMVREEQIEQIPDLLRAISPAKAAQMQKRLIEVYNTFFYSFPAHIFTAIEITRHRASLLGMQTLRKLPHPAPLSERDIPTVYLDSELYWPSNHDHENYTRMP